MKELWIKYDNTFVPENEQLYLLQYKDVNGSITVDLFEAIVNEHAHRFYYRNSYAYISNEAILYYMKIQTL